MAKEPEEGRAFRLDGSSDKDNLGLRVSFLSGLSDGAERRMIHIDQSRQQNLNYALIVFAGLFMFGLAQSPMLRPFILGVLVLAMVAFLLHDRRLHKLIHGWRKTRRSFTEVEATLINSPGTTIEVNVPRFNREGRKEAGWHSLRVWIHLGLAALSAGAFIYLGLVNPWLGKA